MNGKKYLHKDKVNYGGIQRKDMKEALYAENKRLRLKIADLRKRCADLEKQATHDPLTGVCNRRYVESLLAANNDGERQDCAPVSIVMLDVDNLKIINDTFGHPAGDLALSILGEKLRHMTRAEDIVCRYGGDEFIIFLHNVSLETAYKRAEDWRRAVTASPILYQNRQIQITITAGIANYTEHGDTLAETIEAADKALYWAKNMGRNCVVTAGNFNQPLFMFPYEFTSKRDFANVQPGLCN